MPILKFRQRVLVSKRMDDSNKTNHWQALAEELGADTKPQNDAGTKAAESSPPDASSSRASQSRAVKGKARPQTSSPRAPTNWGDVSRQLGIEPDVSAADEGSGPASEASGGEAPAEEALVAAELVAEPGDAESGTDTVSAEENAESQTADAPPRRRRRRAGT